MVEYTSLRSIKRAGVANRPYVKISFDEDVEMPPSRINQALVTGISKVFTSQLDVDLTEFLSLPIDGKQVYLLGLNIATVPKPRTQQTLNEVRDAADPLPGSIEHGLQVVMEKLSEHLPATTDLTPVMVDLGPLGKVPVTTSRFCTPENQRIAPGETVENGLAPLLSTIDDEPHLYQVLIQRNDTREYKITVRTALFGSEHQIRTEADYLDVLNSGRELFPVEPFDNYELSSNLLIMGELLEPHSSHQVKYPWPEQFDHWSDIKPYGKGHPEYRDLLRRRIDYADIYQETGWYPSFIVRERDLTGFLGLKSIHYETDPWESLEYRDSPTLEPLELENPIATHLDSTPSTPTTPEPSGPKDGNKEHWETIKQVFRILLERGWEVEIVDQADGDSIPDLWAKPPGGEPLIIEVANKSSTKPARILLNQLRAEALGVDVWFVGVNKKICGKVASVLNEPFKNATDERTDLYNFSTPVGNGESGTRLLPKSQSAAKWSIKPEGDIEFHGPDGVLGSGDAEEPLSAIEMDTPWYSVENGEYVVRTADDDVRNRYQTKEDLLKDWTELNRGLVPSKLSYIDSATIKYIADHELKSYEPRAEWDTQKASVRHKNSVSAFFDHFVVPREDNAEFKETLRERYRPWTRSLSEHHPADDSWFGQNIPDKFETKANSKDSGKERYYDGLMWRYPRDLEAASLPEFEAEITLPEEWDVDLSL